MLPPGFAWAIAIRLPRRWGAALLATALRAAYQRLNRTGRLDARLLDPQIEWRPPPEAPPPMAGVHRGREQALAELDMWREPFEDFRWDPREFIDAGLRESEWTWVVGGVMSARGRASGAETSVEEFHVWTISRGRALRLSMHLDRAEALATAGVVADSPARESAHPAR